MTKIILSCTITNPKPTIEAVFALGTETVDDFGSDKITIIIGEDADTSSKFHTAVRDMADRFIGELRFTATGESIPPPPPPPPDLEGFNVTFTADEIKVGDNTQAIADSPLPEGAILGKITWSTENPGVATIDPDTGVITGASEGIAEIIGTSDSSISSKNTITITAKVVELESFSVTLDDETMIIGVSNQAIADSPLPEGAILDEVVWSSNDPAVAEIDTDTGVITSIETGKCTITGQSGTITSTAELKVV